VHLATAAATIEATVDAGAAVVVVDPYRLDDLAARMHRV
jgi:hypothetical protein